MPARQRYQLLPVPHGPVHTLELACRWPLGLVPKMAENSEISFRYDDPNVLRPREDWPNG
jgi:hypothetical protein